MEKNDDIKRELLEIISILRDNGVDINSIPITKRREYTVLKDIRQKGIDIESIIRENHLDGNYKIGQKIAYFRVIYKGIIKVQMSDEERTLAEELGVVKKNPTDRQTPLFKGRKISQFHVDFINKHLSDILSGKLNTTEALELLKQASIAENETLIEDRESIKRIVEILLKDKPEELKSYYETLRNNMRKRAIKGTMASKYEPGEYQAEEEKFRNLLIYTYLPQYIKGEITLDTIEQELKISHKTFDQIIKEYYANSGDNEGLNLYEKRKLDNKGASKERRESAKKMRTEIAEYEVVTNAEFLLLSESEQDKQILMKIRQSQLKEEQSGEKSKENFGTRVTTEETTMASIERIKQYFRNKNDYEKGIKNFSEQDIRYMIFRFPTLISRSEQTLDEKLEILTSYDEINEKTAYGMIKSFPAVAGYSADRIKAQLDLLQKEDLIDAIIDWPRLMMQSVNLMYALIEYAKERHKTTDLSGVNRRNIFMGNSTLKLLYKESYEEIKKRFPYDKSIVDDTPYTVSGENIVRATSKDVSITDSDKASEVFDKILETTKEGEKVD